MTEARVLTASAAQAMADIHARAFDRGWPALDMAVHVKTDLCLGAKIKIADPLAAFIIIRASGSQAEILTLATEVSARRKGLARMLILAASKQLAADKTQTLFLEVAEDNIAAQALYKSCGFIPIGRRPAYYRRENGRVAAITFSKALDAVS